MRSEGRGKASGRRSPLGAVSSKLTAALFGVILLFSLAALAAERGLRGMRVGLDDIHEQTLPQVFALKEVGIRIPAVLRLLAAVPDQSSLAGLEGTKAALAQENRALSQAVVATRDDADRVRTQVVRIEETTRALLEAHEQHLAAVRVARSRQLAFEEEVQALTLALDADSILTLAQGGDAEGIRALRVQLFALLGEVRSYPDISDEIELAGAEQRYELARRESVRLLQGIPREKRELRAKQLLDLLVGATSEASQVTAQRSAVLTGQVVETQVAAGQKMGEELQQLALRLASDASDAIDASRTAAQERAQQSQRAVFGLWLCALLASVLILWLYVRRRVARPLEHLAEDLTRLSEGELDVQVRRGGDQEIAQLAGVAEVFRQNALKLESTLRVVESRNATLSEFAYVASHDLKSPLRTIANLAEWVHDDTEGVVSAESSEHLLLLNDRIKKMETLLEELLRYARLGNDIKLVESVNLTELVSQVGDLLSLPASVDVRCEDTDVTLNTIAAPLKLCLRNLIQNAVKHCDQERPSVVVRAQSVSSDFVEISISDNGPGIPEEQREEAVRLFRKLDHSSDGSGMGLALSKRAVELVGGALRIEDAEPRGARIVLSWPTRVAVEQMQPSL